VTGAPDWKGLLWETRGYLGLDEDDPVLRDELVEQAQANGWGEREIQDAIRSTDALELVGDLDDPRVQLADRDEQSDIVDVDDDQEADETPDTEPRTEERTSADSSYADAEFDAPESDAYPPELLEREQWMGHVEKKPFAPWADRDAPAPCTKDEHAAATTDECDCDARWKWGYTENYADGETIAMAEVDPRLDGRAFLQQPDDPFAYVDGDDVRDPETGEVHPAFIAILEHLGLTYADVSQSGAGAHAIFRGELPEGVKEASWQLDDEPWGSNDELPSIEIYPGKRVCVMTGEHVPATPTEIREWNADVLKPLLEANDQYPSSHGRDVSTARDDYQLEDHTPEATSSTETTTDIRDVFYAIDQLDAQRVADRTVVHEWNDDASTSDGERAFVPTWGTGSNGTANIVNSQRWQDTGDRGGYGGPVAMAGIDASHINVDERVQGGVTGEDWFEAVDHLRELGFDIPEYEPDSEDTAESEPVAVLSDSEQIQDVTDGWDWRKAATHGEDDLDIEDARDRCFSTIVDALNSADQVLIEALPTLGKSYSSVAAAAETDKPVTILTGRGRKEQYEQFRTWAREHDLDVYTLPSAKRDCDTANGEHGEDWARRFDDWYTRGATPQDIHANAEYELGRPLPCQEHEGQECPYTSKWRFDPDDYDILLGHYSHAMKRTVVQGRSVIFDEFPGQAYETALGHALPGAVSYFLETTSEIPFDDYTDLIENRRDEQRRADALAWFDDQDLERDPDLVFGSDAGIASAPLAVFTILAGPANGLGNGWEYANLDDGRIGLFDREQGVVYLLTPPDLPYTSSLLALDGTPTKEMWEIALGEQLNHRQVLTTDERQEYITESLNHRYIRTTDAVKPYNSADHIAVQQDTALLEAVHGQHDQQPGLVTTATAETQYETAGEANPLAHISASKHYGNVLGSNEFKQKRLGVVIGSNHFGDRYIEKWGAYANTSVERGDGRGRDLSYGEFGDKVLTHMREHETLQAVMRFGRDGNGAVVYVHTDTLPDWVPVDGEGRVVDTWSDGMRQVLDAARDLGEWTTAEIAAHPDIEIGERQVRNNLTALVERDVVDRELDGTGYVWRDDGLHRLGEHGEVELEPLELEELGEAESAELARSTIYTWEFRSSCPERQMGSEFQMADGSASPDHAVNGGDSTLHDAG